MKAILAINKFNVIGDGQDLIWDVPEDLSFFKQMTIGKSVLMGRNTFTSLRRINGLPNRLNYVLTSSIIPHGEGVQLISSWDECDEEMIIIGGAGMYNHAFQNGLVDTIYVTQILNLDGDRSDGIKLQNDLFNAIPQDAHGTAFFSGSYWDYECITTNFLNSTNSRYQYRIGVLKEKP